jgi:hypothetical protein
MNNDVHAIQFGTAKAESPSFADERVIIGLVSPNLKAL